MDMIKAIDDARIKDFDKMKRSGKVSQFKTDWNILPVFLFKKRLFCLVNEMLQMIESNKIDDDIEAKEFQCQMSVEIVQLEQLFQIAYKWLVINVAIKVQLNKVRLTRGQRRKIKEENISRLTVALEKIFELTGIDIKGEEDLIKLADHIKHHKHKYRELYPDRKPEDGETKELYLLDYASIYAAYMGEPVNGLSEMTFPELKALKLRADDRLKQQKLSNSPENIE